MTNYCLYYLPKSNDPLSDVLVIYFGENKVVTNKTTQNGIDIYLNNLDIIGFAIPEFSKTCKIKIFGTIFLPNDKLIDVINSILDNASLPTLEYKNKSGFTIGQVDSVEVLENKMFLYKINIGTEFIYSESSYVLEKNHKVVVALNGTYILPAKMITSYNIKENITSGGRICNFEDLQINMPKQNMPVLVDEDLNVGRDFFMMEEKVYA